VTVTLTAGEFQKLAVAQISHINRYHVTTEAVSRSAAHIPCQDLKPLTVLEHTYRLRSGKVLDQNVRLNVPQQVMKREVALDIRAIFNAVD